jgi:DNA-binding transcriptional MerR regulator
VSYGNRMHEQQDDIDLRLLNVAKELGFEREEAKHYVKQQKERIHTLIDAERMRAFSIADGREVGLGKDKH